MRLAVWCVAVMVILVVTTLIQDAVVQRRHKAPPADAQLRRRLISGILRKL